MKVDHPDVKDGMFVASENGVSFHCVCGWVSDIAETENEAQDIAIAHVVSIKYRHQMKPEHRRGRI